MFKFIFNFILIIFFVPINVKSKSNDLNSIKTNFLNLYIIAHKDFNNYITNQNYKIICEDFFN